MFQSLNSLRIIERFNQDQLIEAERTHLQRESLVRHLYDSEEDYLRSLQDILNCYKRPMLLNAQHPDGGSSGTSKMSSLLGGSSSVSSKAVASRAEIDTLFGNLDQLIEFHEGIRSMLENRSKIWGPTQIMSDLLLSVIPKFKIYSRYFTNFHFALTILDRISRTPQYKKFMEVRKDKGSSLFILLLASYTHRQLIPSASFFSIAMCDRQSSWYTQPTPDACLPSEAHFHLS